MNTTTNIIVQIGTDGPVKEFKGRFAWALAELLRAGNEGVTTLERPAPPWSHYIYGLRRDGLVIETQDERHSGPYAGRHGRYRLTTPVTVLSEEASHG